MNSRVVNLAAVIGIFAITVYTLFIGKALLLPFVSAIVIWYLIVRLTEMFEGVPGTGLRLPYGVSLLISLVATLFILFFFFNFFAQSITSIVGEAPKYQAKLQDILNQVNALTGYKLDINNLLTHINFSNVFSTVAVTLSSLTGYLSLIIIYVLLLLMEYRTFDAKLKAMCDDKRRYEKVNDTFTHIATSINTYLKIKTVASALTGVLSFVVLLGFQIDYAGFWGVLIFMLNFIPTIGSIVAVTFVLLAVSIQISTLGALAVLASLLIIIQFLVGNIIEPKFMGSYLNLSPIVILFSLAFWGKIWGITGMLLCVPFMTILNIILAEFKQSRPIAILLSANGEV